MGASIPDTDERLPAIVWMATLDNRTTYVSPQVEQLLGVPVETWLSSPSVHTSDRPVRTTMPENVHHAARHGLAGGAR